MQCHGINLNSGEPVMFQSDISRLQPARSLMENSLWNHDCYPDLPDLAPRSTITMARFSGPGVVRTIHLTLHIPPEQAARIRRDVGIQITYENSTFPSVDVPVGDFFGDSFAGASVHFATPAIANRPTNSWFCYLPMPFSESVEIKLVNNGDQLVTGYGYVTAESMTTRHPDSAYFHAKWIHKTVQLPQEDLPLLTTTGQGHFLGCHLTAISACPHFLANQGICEGNDEFYIDGAAEPAINYLGTEDFFGFSWNWRNIWTDNFAGTTFLSDENSVTRLACYRFLWNDPVRFNTSLRARINYEYETRNQPLIAARAEENGQVEFGVVVYWYQSEPTDPTRC
jgi:D-arabinan exo alpha-(1,3)/(1,5)-arabinofuranosidase (non-reducing end)